MRFRFSKKLARYRLDARVDHRDVLKYTHSLAACRFIRLTPSRRRRPLRVGEALAGAFGWALNERTRLTHSLARFDVALLCCESLFDACILLRNVASQTSLSLRESRELSSGEGELLIRFLLAHTAICDSPSPSLRLRPSRREGEATQSATSKRASEWIRRPAKPVQQKPTAGDLLVGSGRGYDSCGLVRASRTRGPRPLQCVDPLACASS